MLKPLLHPNVRVITHTGPTIFFFCEIYSRGQFAREVDVCECILLLPMNNATQPKLGKKQNWEYKSTTGSHRQHSSFSGNVI